MSRIKLIEQSSYEFHSSLYVRITDINIANHLGHVELVGMMHEARHQFFQALGFNELSIGAEKTGIVIVDLAINYLCEVFAGECIDIDLLIGDMTERSFRIYYRLKRNDDIIALAETGIAPFIYGEKRAIPIPDFFISSLRKFRQQLDVVI